MVDHGPHFFDSEDDYPVAVLRAAEAVAGDSGRSASCWAGPATASRWPRTRSRASARRWPTPSRSPSWRATHNNAQVVSIGGRFTATELAKEIVDMFVATEFSGVERHVRRLEMVTRYEDDGTLPPEPATA